MYSDSYYEEDRQILEEQNLKNEIKTELKRKRALEEDHVQQNDEDLFAFEEYFQPKFKRENMTVKSVTNQNELWYCPCVQPPLASDLEGKFKVNNDPIVSYYKEDDKFKLVFKNFFILKTNPSFYKGIKINFVEIKPQQIRVKVQLPATTSCH